MARFFPSPDALGRMAPAVQRLLDDLAI